MCVHGSIYLPGCLLIGKTFIKHKDLEDCGISCLYPPILAIQGQVHVHFYHYDRLPGSTLDAQEPAVMIEMF